MVDQFYSSRLSLRQRFLKLTDFLRRFAPLWREQAFYGTPLEWRQIYPALDQALLQLSDAEYQCLDENPQALLAFMSKYLPEFATLQPFLELPNAVGMQGVENLDKRLGIDVPGRKWQQIEAFIGALDERRLKPESKVVDWCSGKSHLGRTAANKLGVGLHAIERDPHMCSVGQQMAVGVVKGSIHFECRDVLAGEAVFGINDYVLALHACGDLHRTLLQQWRTSASGHLHLAPCCYHQWLEHDYQPLSLLAKRHNLQLTKNQVRIAVQEMVTSPQRIRRKTDQLKVWRLAFDEMQRELRQLDEYLPTPSLPISVVGKGFEYVMHQLALKKSLEIPDTLNLAPYLTRAQHRYQNVQRLNLAALAFRRSLELWLVIDLALYLEETKCNVNLKQFCPRSLTPRNILLSAER
ncbi:MAG: SAM-dependent methyltransferase [Pseudomonadales bacterium]|nr:SAM-dependent methyltransferase [Pseudomonadales bacterium]